MRRLAVVLACALALPSVAFAQTCQGGADISKAQPGHLTGGITLDDENTGLAIGGLGGNDDFYGGGEFTTNWHDDPFIGEFTTLGFTSIAAAQLKVPNRRVMVCPLFMLNNDWARNIQDSGANLYFMDIIGGVAFGARVVESRTVTVVPTVQLGFSRSRVSTNVLTDSYSETVGVFRAGVGFVLNQRLTLTPSIRTVFAIQDSPASNTFEIRLSVNFPRK